MLPAGGWKMTTIRRCKDCIKFDKCPGNHNPNAVKQIDSNKFCKIVTRDEIKYWHEIFKEPFPKPVEPKKKTPEQKQLEIDEAAETEIYL
jgi:hypothetical protein